MKHIHTKIQPKLLAGKIPSYCRNSAGRTIWPLLEIVVFINRKILFYRHVCQRVKSTLESGYMLKSRFLFEHSIAIYFGELASRWLFRKPNRQRTLRDYTPARQRHAETSRTPPGQAMSLFRGSSLETVLNVTSTGPTVTIVSMHDE